MLAADASLPIDSQFRKSTMELPPNGRARRITPTKRRFMLTNFHQTTERYELSSKIQSLGGEVLDDPSFDTSATHIIARLPARNEKYLCGCASGKWVLTSSYIADSYHHGRWLDEEAYEWNMRHVLTSVGGTTLSKPGAEQLASAPRHWREACAARQAPFSGWRVLVLVKDKTKLDAFKKLIVAGGGKVVSLQLHFLKPNTLKTSHVTHAFSAEPPTNGLIRAVSNAGLICLHPDYIPNYLVDFPAGLCSKSKYLTSTYMPHALTKTSGNASTAPTPPRSPKKEAPASSLTAASPTRSQAQQISTELFHVSAEQSNGGAATNGDRPASRVGSSPVRRRSSQDSTHSAGAKASRHSSVESCGSTGGTVSKNRRPSQDGGLQRKRSNSSNGEAGNSKRLSRLPSNNCVSKGTGAATDNATPSTPAGTGTRGSGVCRSPLKSSRPQLQPSSFLFFSPSKSSPAGGTASTPAGELTRRPTKTAACDTASASDCHTGPARNSSSTPGPQDRARQPALASLSSKLTCDVSPPSDAVETEQPVSPQRQHRVSVLDRLKNNLTGTSFSLAPSSSCQPSTPPPAAMATVLSRSPLRQTSALDFYGNVRRKLVNSPVKGDSAAALAAPGSPSNVSSLVNGAMATQFAGDGSELRSGQSSAATVEMPPLSPPCHVSPRQPLRSSPSSQRVVAHSNGKLRGNRNFKSARAADTPRAGTSGLTRYRSSSLTQAAKNGGVTLKAKPVKRALSFSRALALKNAGLFDTVAQEISDSSDSDDDGDGDVPISPARKRANINMCIVSEDEDDGDVPMDDGVASSPVTSAIFLPAAGDAGVNFGARDIDGSRNRGGAHSLDPPIAVDYATLDPPIAVDYAALSALFPERQRDSIGATLAKLPIQQFSVALPSVSSTLVRKPLAYRFRKEWHAVSHMYAESSEHQHLVMLMHCIRFAADTPILPTPHSLNILYHQCLLECDDYQLSCTAYNLLCCLLAYNPPNRDFATMEMYWLSLADKNDLPNSSPTTASPHNVFIACRAQRSKILSVFESGESTAGLNFFCRFIVTLLRDSLARHVQLLSEATVSQGKARPSLVHFIFWPGGGDCNGMTEPIRRLLKAGVKLAERASLHCSSADGERAEHSHCQHERLQLALDLVALVAECCELCDGLAGTHRRRDVLVRELQLCCQSVNAATTLLLERCRPAWLRSIVAWKLAVPRLVQIKNVYSPAKVPDVDYAASIPVPASKELVTVLQRLSSRCRQAAKQERLLTASPARRPVEFAAAHSPVNKRNIKGESKLQVQCIKNRVGKVRELLQLGADPNLADNAGWTALHEVANYGHSECARALLDVGATVDKHGQGVFLLATADGVTALHDAAEGGHLEVARLLVETGGPVLLRAVDDNGLTPLDRCPAGGEYAELRALLTGMGGGGGGGGDGEEEEEEDMSQTPSSSQRDDGSGAMAAVVKSLLLPAVTTDPELNLLARLLRLILAARMLGELDS